MTNLYERDLVPPMPRFDRMAKASERTEGHQLAYAGAGGVIIIWLLSGPLFGFSDTDLPPKK